MSSTEMLCARPWTSLTLPPSQAKSILRVLSSAVALRCNQSIPTPLLLRTLSWKDEAWIVSLKRQSSTPLVVSQSIPRQNSTWINNRIVDVVDVGKALESKVDAKTIDVVTLGNLCVDIVKHVRPPPFVNLQGALLPLVHCLPVLDICDGINFQWPCRNCRQPL
jgi:hypothetical protein